MSNKLKAALFVVLYTLASITAIAAVRITLDYLQPTLEQVGITFALLLLAYAMKMLFDMRLGQLESRDRLREITKTNPTLK
jgi:hypothetical protein